MNDLIHDDNGEYNFGDLDLSDETAVGDYDFADLTEGADPDTVAVGNYDFNTILSEINAFIIRMIKLGVHETLRDENIQVFERPEYNEAGMEIFYQFYYSKKSNTLFIEYNFNQNFLNNFDESDMSRNIEKFIKANLRKDIIGYIEDSRYVGTLLWPRIVFISGNNKNSSTLMLTPSTIGYWDSLIHKKVFLNDKTEMQVNLLSFINDLPDDYKSAIHAIFDMYYMTDFETFTKKYYEALHHYRIDFTSKFVTKLSDYVGEVLALAREYRQVSLTEDQKIQYIHAYSQLYHDYHTDMVLFEQKVEELNQEYGVAHDPNSELPEVFEKYKQIVYDTFGVELDNVNDNSIGGYIEVYLNK